MRHRRVGRMLSSHRAPCIQLYSLFRPLLFALDPGAAHDATFARSTRPRRAGVRRSSHRGMPRSPVTAMGHRVSEPVGLAAGLDKNGAAHRGLAALGFGFIESGTVDAAAAAGQPAAADVSLARVGSADQPARLQQRRCRALRRQRGTRVRRIGGVLGINIGKNFDTPNERAADDYVSVPARRVRARAATSPSTSRRRTPRVCATCSRTTRLPALLRASQAPSRQRWRNTHGRHVPLAVKIAPDLTPRAIRRRRAAAVEHADRRRDRDQHDDRPRRGRGPAACRRAGRTVRAAAAEQSTQVDPHARRALDGALPIIGVGGILSRRRCEGEDRRRRDARAALHRPHLSRACAAWPNASRRWRTAEFRRRQLRCGRPASG